MNTLGIHLTLLIGPTIAVPAPPILIEALQSVEVTHTDEGRSGFQITFNAGRGEKFGLMDYPLLNNPLLKPFNRAILIVTFNAMPRVLMDGIITHQQLTPSNEPGASTITVTGEDVSLMMDMEEKSAEHPAQDETVIAIKIILSYAKYGLIPMVIPPTLFDPPLPIERIPVQQETDLKYLETLAKRYGYVFYVIPGPAPFTNTAYWGPPKRAGLPQKALSINLGGETNLESINFQNNAISVTTVSGKVQDRITNQSMPVETFASLRLPLSSQPAWLVNQLNIRRIQFRQTGLNMVQALSRAQGIMDASSDVVKADGVLDTSRYNDILQARELVGLRGTGYSYDGLYYVKRVTHKINISKGEYKQNFTLTREGIGALTPVVIP
jgi:hypothetical protein